MGVDSIGGRTIQLVAEIEEPVPLPRVTQSAPTTIAPPAAESRAVPHGAPRAGVSSGTSSDGCRHSRSSGGKGAPNVSSSSPSTPSATDPEATDAAAAAGRGRRGGSDAPTDLA